MKNQLPGGCHTSDDEAKRQESCGLDVFNRCIWFEMSYLFHVSKVFLTRSIMFRYRNGFLSLGFIAIIGKIITTPFMKLVDSKTFATHILDLNKHFHQLQIDGNQMMSYHQKQASYRLFVYS
jgi:hypothetical protein